MGILLEMSPGSTKRGNTGQTQVEHRNSETIIETFKVLLKIDKLNLMKIKRFCSTKDPVKRMERQSYVLGENIFKLHI